MSRQSMRRKFLTNSLAESDFEVHPTRLRQIARAKLHAVQYAELAHRLGSDKEDIERGIEPHVDRRVQPPENVR